MATGKVPIIENTCTLIMTIQLLFTSCVQIHITCMFVVVGIVSVSCELFNSVDLNI